jgi:hypothetical protein
MNHSTLYSNIPNAMIRIFSMFRESHKCSPITMHHILTLEPQRFEIFGATSRFDVYRFVRGATSLGVSPSLCDEDLEPYNHGFHVPSVTLVRSRDILHLSVPGYEQPPVSFTSIGKVAKSPRDSGSFTLPHCATPVSSHHQELLPRQTFVC